jgi:hypothetical protein
VLLWSHKPKGKRHKKSRFVLDVSRTGFNDLPRQIRDAMRFLKANQPVLRSLRRFPGVDSVNLDFGINRTRGAVVQCESFPSELLRRAGELSVELTISFHAP